MDSLNNVSNNINNNNNNNCQLSDGSSPSHRLIMSNVNQNNNQNNNNVNNNNNNNVNNNNSNANGHHNQNNNSNNIPQSDIRHTYTIAGIVQFLQYEWQRFELHRQQWEVEKSELQARIALLQGERKGQENLKNDLIRRIKMLEYCLKQERAKYHKLKHGVDPPDHLNDAGGDELNDLNFELDDTVDSLEQKNLNWKQGRQLLRHYLQEIGYTDTIIDIRSNRVRSLLGLTNLNEEVTSEKAVSKILHLSECRNQAKRNKKDLMAKPSNNNMMIDTESSVLATFEFLGNQNDHEIDSMDAEEEDVLDTDTHGHIGDDAEEVMQEFDMMLNNPMVERDLNWKSNVRKDVDLGELASLTETDNDIDNGNGSACTPATSNGASGMRKTWSQKYILKSHYDCIRALRFHPTESLLITASEDETLKLWNLNKTQPSSKSKQQMNAPNAIDLEPIYTYRGHLSSVLSLHVTNGNMFYSGAQDGKVISWSMPSNVMNLDPYDPFDCKLQLNTIAAHDDAVWALTSMTTAASDGHILCSASADGSIKVWNTARSICLKSFEQEGKTPTDLATIGSLSLNASVGSSSMLLAAFNDGSLAMYDIESAAAASLVLQFEMVPSCGSINAIAVHPTMPIVITAHQYRLIKLWDINTGKCIHSMVAHLDEVTSVDCDANGWYILSGSHDCSVRLWNFDSKNCVQEITSHRKKFDEAIFDVTFHPSKPYFASAGADGLAKVFV